MKKLLRHIASALLLALVAVSALPADTTPPRFGSVNWREPVAALADLPSGGGSMNELGDCRVVRDSADRGIYCWFNSWLLIAEAVPTGGYVSIAGDEEVTGAKQFTADIQIQGIESPSGTTWRFTGEETGLAIDIATGGLFSLDLNSDDTADFYGDSNGIRSLLPLGILRAATLPTCNSTLAPAGVTILAYDTTGPDLCLCAGTSWAPVDGSGTCA